MGKCLKIGDLGKFQAGQSHSIFEVHLKYGLLYLFFFNPIKTSI